MFRFKCACCDAWHEGVPSYGAAAPLYFYGIPEAERLHRCRLTSDTCIVDEKVFFIRGNIEIHVHGADEAFSWGVWVSLSKPNFDSFHDYLHQPARSHIGPFFGWLSAELEPLYPSTENLKTRAHLRDNGIRPFIELEPTDHPLAVEQRNGITAERVAEIVAHFGHGDGQ